MNKAIIIGRLTRDPEMRTTGSGINSTSFTVAVSRNFSGSNNAPTADFISCVAWRRQAENIAKYCTKGSQVAVEGRIQTRNYDAQDGTKRYTTDVAVDSFDFIGSNSGAARSNDSFNNNNNGNSGYSAPSNDDRFGGESFNDDITPVDDGDMPF